VRAQGMRFVDAKKSKYYEAALSNFVNAMRCFERAGLTDEWAETVNDIRSRHHRKSGFMSGFERLLAGSGRYVRHSRVAAWCPCSVRGSAARRPWIPLAERVEAVPLDALAEGMKGLFPE